VLFSEFFALKYETRKGFMRSHIALRVAILRLEMSVSLHVRFFSAMKTVFFYIYTQKIDLSQLYLFTACLFNCMAHIIFSRLLWKKIPTVQIPEKIVYPSSNGRLFGCSRRPYEETVCMPFNLGHCMSVARNWKQTETRLIFISAFERRTSRFRS
jgi:hypothetical protein